MGKKLPYTHTAFVIENYLKLTNAEMARQLGCSAGGVKSILKSLGIVIPAHIIAERKQLTRFKNGQISHNKGKKQTDYMTPEAIANTAKTRFKKGRLPHNCYNEIGKIVVRGASGFGQSGNQLNNVESKPEARSPKLALPEARSPKPALPYKYICTAIGKWELYHRYLWQQTHGAIPQGHCIWFKDGDTMNCSIENLECISRKENRYRNSAPQKLSAKFLARTIVGKNGNTAGLLNQTQLLETKKTHILINRKIKQHGKQQNERP